SARCVEILGRTDILALYHTLTHDGIVFLKMRLQARLMDGIRLCGNRQPTWIEFLSFCRFWKLDTFYIGPQPVKHLAAGPDGLGHLRVNLVPENGFCKGKTEATHAVFEGGRGTP